MKFLYSIIIFLAVCCEGFAKVNLDSTQIQRLLQSLQTTHHLPGIQVTVKDTELNQTWNFSTGFRDRESLAPLENHHLMQIGSTTKSFTASLALLLEADSEKGILKVPFNIDQTIGDWLPQYPEWRTIKIRNLLNMTSGIDNYTEDENLFQAVLKDPKRIWHDSELVALAYSKSLLFPAGTKYSYCNTNYILMGMILEKAAGVPFEVLINERILKKYPDRFKHTTYSPKTYPQAEMPLMAHGYAMHPEKNPGFYGQDITAVNLSWAGAAGALISTSADLVHWVELLFSEDFLPKKQRDELESLVCIDTECKDAHPLPKDSKSMGYGLGVGRLHDPRFGHYWTHNGGTLGYHTVFIYLSQKSVIVSVIVNQIGPQIDEVDDIIFIAQQIFENIEIL